MYHREEVRRGPRSGTRTLPKALTESAAPTKCTFNTLQCTDR